MTRPGPPSDTRPSRPRPRARTAARHRSHRCVGLGGLLLAALCGCTPSTSVKLTVTGSPEVPLLDSMRVRVFDDQGILGSPVVFRFTHKKLPGTIVIDDAGSARDLRVLIDGLAPDASVIAQAATRVTPVPHKQLLATTELRAGTLPDRDGDGIPDPLDDCPGLPDPSQGSSRTCATDDAGAMPPRDQGGAAAWSCAASYRQGQQHWTCADGVLDRCDTNGVAQQVVCPGGACVSDPAGGDDQCDWDCAQSRYQNQQYWTCSGGNLFECDAAGRRMMIYCGNLGCKPNGSGMNDACWLPSPGWSCASSQGTDGNQYLTCSADGNVHECHAGIPVELKCANGCNVNPVNTDDTCR